MNWKKFGFLVALALAAVAVFVMITDTSDAQRRRRKKAKAAPAKTEIAENALKVARPTNLPGNCGPENLFHTWQCDNVRLGMFGATMGDYVSLAINSADVPYIAYYGDAITNPGNLYIAYQQYRIFLPMSMDD